MPLTQKWVLDQQCVFCKVCSQSRESVEKKPPGRLVVLTTDATITAVDSFMLSVKLIDGILMLHQNFSKLLSGTHVK